MKERKKWIDVARLIAIIGVVFGHSTKEYSYPFFFVYSYCVPLFFICTGYTSRAAALADIPKSVVKDFKRLMIPYFLMYWAQSFIYTIIGRITPSELSIRLLNVFVDPLIGASWFFSALFIAKIIHKFLLLIKLDIVRLIICGGLAVLGAYIGQVHMLPFCADCALPATFFLEIGYLYKNYENRLKEMNVTFEPLWTAVPIALYAWLYPTFVMENIMSFGVRIYSVSAFTASVAADLIVILVIKEAEKKWGNTIVFSVMQKLGQNTLTLFLVHYFDEIWMEIITPSALNKGIIYSLFRLGVDLILTIAIMQIAQILKKRGDYGKISG